MPTVLPFPDRRQPHREHASAEPPTCGRLAFGVPVHVWSPGAQVGDPCHCGALVLTYEPAVLTQDEFALTHQLP